MTSTGSQCVDAACVTIGLFECRFNSDVAVKMTLEFSRSCSNNAQFCVEVLLGFRTWDLKWVFLRIALMLRLKWTLLKTYGIQVHNYRLLVNVKYERPDSNISYHRVAPRPHKKPTIPVVVVS